MAHVNRWSAAACAPLASLAFATSAPAQAPGACPGAQLAPTAKTIPAARAATLCLINRERAAQGLAPVAGAAVLEWTAQAHTDLMVAWRSFSHSKGVARSLSGLYWAFGQNIAWAEDRMAAPEIVVAAWMASPAHRRNILNADYTHMGIGVTMGAPETTPLSAATYATDFGAAIAKETHEAEAEAESQERSAGPANMDSTVVAPAVAPPGAERRMRPAVRLPRLPKRAKACSSRSRAARRSNACVKRRPKVTIRTRRSTGSTSFLIQ